MFREESSISWMWPLARRPSEEKKEMLSKQAVEEEESCTHEQDGFDLADRMEKGISRELVTEFMQPLRRSSRLWKFQVQRLEDQSFRLCCNSGEFLMFARMSGEKNLVHFYPYDLSRSVQATSSRPCFTMTFDDKRTVWKLAQERCESCHHLPRHLSCTCRGKQQVASIRHSRQAVGDGVQYCMDCNIPMVHSDGSRDIWCPRIVDQDMGSSSPPASPGKTRVLTLQTKMPVWHEEVESLVLDFRGRSVLPSAKNFQLVSPTSPNHVVCQFGKIAHNTFGLDFRHPLSVIQAFSFALTTAFWT